VNDLDRMDGLPFQRMVSRSVGPGAARLAADEALREALQLAQLHDGLVLDLQTPRVVDTGSTPRPAAEMFTFEYDLEDLGTIRTHGLNVIGLPEIILRGVPEDERRMYDMVVVGLVHRLLDEWPEHDPVGPARVTLGDITAGYEGGDSTDADRGVDVLIDYDAQLPALTVEVMTSPGTALF
jgi:hypothetical protein